MFKFFKKRNIAVFVLCAVLAIINCLSVSAKENGLPAGLEEIMKEYPGLTFLYSEEAPCSDNTIQPMAYEVCGGLSYHKMMSTGIGFADVNGSRYITGGAAWQCSNCKLVMVTEGDYYYGQMTTIGKWATMYADEKVSGTGVYILVPSAYGYCASSSMDGYKFFLQ